MAFQRIGTPVNLDNVSFDGTGSYGITCEHCGKSVGRGNKRLARFAGTEIVVVAARTFVCPFCGKTSKIVKDT